MKKILIALLSLAMLFSFAACDNSNDTPANPETPADPTVSDYLIGLAMTKVGNSMNAGAGSIRTLLTGDLLDPTNGKTVEFDVANKTSITISDTIEPAGEAIPAETVKLEITGIETSAKNANSASGYDVALNEFTYTYSGSVTGSGNNVPFTATVKGYFADTANAKIKENSSTKALGYTVTEAATLTVVLPQSSQGITLVIDGKPVDNIAFAFDSLNNTAVTGGSVTVYKPYKAYESEMNSTFKTAVDGVVKQLIVVDSSSTNDSDLVSKLSGWVTSSPAAGSSKTASEWSAKYDETAKTVTFKLTASVNPIEVSAPETPAKDDVKVALAAGKTMTVVFNVDTTAGIVAKSYAITGDFVAATYDSTWSAWSDELSVSISGDIDDAGDASANKLSFTADGSDVRSITPTGSYVYEVASGSSVTSTIEYGPLLTSAADPDEVKIALAVLADKEVKREYTAVNPYPTV